MGFHVAVLNDAPPTAWGVIAEGIEAGTNDSMVVQYRFDELKFTAEQVQTWLSGQGIVPVRFIPVLAGIAQISPGAQSGPASGGVVAGGEAVAPGGPAPGGAMSAPADFRDIEARSLSVGVPRKFEDTPDGGLLIRDVTLLTSGEWTDSAVKTPLYYPADVLERHAGSWSKSDVYASHNTQHNGLRPVLEKVGRVMEPHAYKGTVVGNVMLHRKSQSSRDIAEMVQAGILNAVSVEHYGRERWNASASRYEATDIDFRGLAFVEEGACPGARINAALANKVISKEDNTMENEAIQKELAAQKATVESSLADIAKKLAGVEELTKKVADLEKAVAQRRSLAASEKPKYDPYEGLAYDKAAGTIERA